MEWGKVSYVKNWRKFFRQREEPFKDPETGVCLVFWETIRKLMWLQPLRTIPLFLPTCSILRHVVRQQMPLLPPRVEQQRGANPNHNHNPLSGPSLSNEISLTLAATLYCWLTLSSLLAKSPRTFSHRLLLRYWNSSGAISQEDIKCGSGFTRSFILDKTPKCHDTYPWREREWGKMEGEECESLI